MIEKTTSVIEQEIATATARALVADFTRTDDYSEKDKPVVSAAFLRDLILGFLVDPQTRERILAPAGIRIVGVRVEGPLTVTGCLGEGLPGLTLERCELPGRIDLSGSRIANVSIKGSSFRELWAFDCLIDGDLDLSRTSPLSLPGETDEPIAYVRAGSSRIDGTVYGSAAALNAPRSIPRGMIAKPAALSLLSSEVTGNIVLDEGFRAVGLVILHGANVTGGLFLGGAQLTATSDYALYADNAQFGGSVDLTNRGQTERPPFKSAGTLSFDKATIGGDFDGRTAMLSSSNGIALSLSGAAIQGRGALSSGFEANGMVSLESARIRGNLECQRGRFLNVGGTALTASGASIEGSVVLGDLPKNEHEQTFEAAGRVDFRGATIKGTVDCRRGIFAAPNCCIDMASISVAGSVLFSHGAKFSGAVYITGSQISGDLDCSGSAFLNANSVALHGDGLDVGRNVVLAKGFIAEGGVQLATAKIGKDLVLNGGSFTHPAAVYFPNALIGGDLEMGAGFVSNGTVYLRGTRIKGSILGDGAKITRPGSMAIAAEGAHIEGDVWLGKGAAFAGSTIMRGITIQGSLGCAGGIFENDDEAALSLEGAKIGGAVVLRDGFKAVGQVSLLSATVGSHFDCAGGSFHHAGRLALNAEMAQIGGSVLFGRGFHAKGIVSLVGVQIIRAFTMSRAKIDNPAGWALSARDASIKGMVSIGPEVEIDGSFNLTGLHVENDVFIEQSKFKNGADVSPFAFGLDQSRIEGTLHMRHNDFVGAASLDGARIARLYDDPDTAWRGASAVTLEELNYQQLGSQIEARLPIWRARADWLKRNTHAFADRLAHDFSAQPWRECVQGLERAGYFADARWLLRKMKEEANAHRARLTPLNEIRRTRDKAPKSAADFFSVVIAALLITLKNIWSTFRAFCVWFFAEQLFGYGLSVTRATVTAISFWLLGALGVHVMHARGMLIEEAKWPPESCRTISPAIYALDVAIPFLDLRQESQCQPGTLAPSGFDSSGFPLPPPLVGWNAFSELSIWIFAKAAYAIAGAAVFGFAVLTWTGVLRPKNLQA